jgi:hypothetical protein
MASASPTDATEVFGSRLAVRRLACTILTAATLAGRVVASQTSPAAAESIVPAISQETLLRSFGVLAADSMEGRRAGTPGSARARAFIIGELTKVGVQPFVPAFSYPFSARSQFPPHAPVPYGDGMPVQRGRSGPDQNPWVSGVNILGVVHGTERPGRYIFVSAHYDHLGVAGGEIYNGADDNASGSAGILAIAEWVVHNPQKNSIVFAWFDAEEEGLLGSTAFVRRLPVKRDSIVADVNLDMVSRNAHGEIFLAGARHWPVLQPLVNALDSLGLATIRQGHDAPGMDDWTKRTDSGAFDQENIPYIHFGVEEHPDYHRPSDKMFHVQPDFYYYNVRLAAQMMRLMDASADSIVKFKHRR